MTRTTLTFNHRLLRTDDGGGEASSATSLTQNGTEMGAQVKQYMLVGVGTREKVHALSQSLLTVTSLRV